MVALDGNSLEDGATGAKAVVVNEYEMEILSKKTGRSPSDMLELTEAVVVTLSERGAQVFTRADPRPTHVPAVKVRQLIDPVSDRYEQTFGVRPPTVAAPVVT
jgi:adenosine kinase